MEEFCRLYHMHTREHFSQKISLSLASAETNFLVRLTGGAAKIDIDKGFDAIRLLTTAFRGYSGVMLYGGTRVIGYRRHGPTVIPSIMEVPPILQSQNPNMVTFGIVPRSEEHFLCEHGIIVSQNPELGCVTIINPNQTVCLTVQQDVDTPATYDVEWQYCLYHVVETFMKYGKRANYGCALVSYEGGTYTKKEILAWASRNLPVILCAGSGRTTDVLARDKQWLADHPSVVVCEDASEIRQTLTNLGGLK